MQRDFLVLLVLGTESQEQRDRRHKVLLLAPDGLDGVLESAILNRRAKLLLLSKPPHGPVIRETLLLSEPFQCV